MSRLAFAVILAVELSGGFGSATADVVSTTGQSVVVELEVEVTGEVDTVVAHLALPGEEQVTIPMLDRGDGTYGVTTELKAADYLVVFESVGDSGSQSEPVTLSDLGADLGADGGAEGDEGGEESERSPETNRWLWLGVALGAASLSALAFWVLGERDDHDDDHDPSQPSTEEPVADSVPSEALSAGDPTSDN